MTRDTKRGSVSALATGVIQAVVTNGRRGAHLLRHLHAWWRYETTVRELWSLSDRELGDLGITRKDIARVVSEPLHPEDRAKYRVR